MTNIKMPLAAAFAMFLLIAPTLTGQDSRLADKKVLTLEAAKQIAAAAAKEACKPQCRGVIAIVDDGGTLIYLERFDKTQISNVELAIRKARTAAIYQQPTSFFRSSLEKGDLHYGSYPDVISANGGVPLVIGDQVIGGFGESGYTVGSEGHHTDTITAAALDELKKISSH